VHQHNGQIFLFFLMVTTISLLLLIGLVSLQSQSYRMIKRITYSKQATYIAEAGLDKGYASFIAASTYTGETLTLGEGSAIVTLTAGPTANEKYLTSVATVNGVTKRLRTKLVTSPNSTAVAFNYALQSGSDGMTMGNNSVINGSAYSNGNIAGGNNSSITGNASAVGTVGTAITVGGTRQNNAATQALPGFDAAFWKQKAQNGGTYTGGYIPTHGSTIGPLYINGSIHFGQSTHVTIAGPIYATGTIDFGNSTVLIASNTLGSSGAMIIAEGSILIGNGVAVAANAGGGTLLFASTSTSGSAINIFNNANTQIGPLYAPNGTLVIGNNARAVAFTGKRVSLGANVVVNYDTGLASATYSYGAPTGGWVMEKGSYEEY
jgi:hypothetical protein